MKTTLTQLFDIKYPIVQGGMAWVSDAQLVAAVAAAGAIGSIASGGRTAQWLSAEIDKAKALTDRPFGVNLVLQDDDVEQKKAVILKKGVAYVATGAGNPLPHIADFQAAGIKVMPVVPNLKLAKRVAAAGADAIVVEGLEAGGHIGKLTTMALMSQVLPEVDIPVIVAGGIVDGRAMAAALLMGAAGVQLGTRFYASSECMAHPMAKLAIVKATDVDSETTGRRGREVRGLKNALTERYHQMVAAGASAQALSELVNGTTKLAPLQGDVDWGMVQAGQSLTPIDQILSCRDIVENLVRDAKRAIVEANRYLE